MPQFRNQGKSYLSCSALSQQQGSHWLGTSKAQDHPRFRHAQNKRVRTAFQKLGVKGQKKIKHTLRPVFPVVFGGKGWTGRQNDLHQEVAQKFLNTKMQEPCQRALFGQRWLIFGNKTVRSVWMNVIRMKFGWYAPITSQSRISVFSSQKTPDYWTNVTLQFHNQPKPLNSNLS